MSDSVCVGSVIVGGEVAAELVGLAYFLLATPSGLLNRAIQTTWIV